MLNQACLLILNLTRFFLQAPHFVSAVAFNLLLLIHHLVVINRIEIVNQNDVQEESSLEAAGVLVNAEALYFLQAVDLTRLDQLEVQVYFRTALPQFPIKPLIRL